MHNTRLVVTKGQMYIRVRLRFTLNVFFARIYNYQLMYVFVFLNFILHMYVCSD